MISFLYYGDYIIHFAIFLALLDNILVFFAHEATRKRDYSRHIKPESLNLIGDRPLGNSIGVLLGCEF